MFAAVVSASVGFCLWILFILLINESASFKALLTECEITAMENSYNEPFLTDLRVKRISKSNYRLDGAFQISIENFNDFDVIIDWNQAEKRNLYE